MFSFLLKEFTTEQVCPEGHVMKKGVSVCMHPRDICLKCPPRVTPTDCPFGVQQAHDCNKCPEVRWECVNAKRRNFGLLSGFRGNQIRIMPANMTNYSKLLWVILFNIWFNIFSLHDLPAYPEIWYLLLELKTVWHQWDRFWTLPVISVGGSAKAA